MSADPWVNAIVRSDSVPPITLNGNPMNWRQHPPAQMEALKGILGSVGWVDRILVNERTGHIVDGHARVQLAIERGEDTVPVDYVDIDEDMEKLVLATFDPIAAMAHSDKAILGELAEQCSDNLEQLVGGYSPIDGARHGLHAYETGNYEWYTPKEITGAAREVMGGIDLDPASCSFANEMVGATEFFSEEQNGLEQQWSGRVFLNPPFANPTVRYFAEKLIDSFKDESVAQAVWLSNACIEVEWWHQLATLGDVCFHRGRMKFIDQDGQQPGQATQGQTIIYLGPERDAFRSEFSNFGVVLSYRK